MAKELKYWKISQDNLMYHFVEAPVRVRWEGQSQMESSTQELEEHHKW